MKKIVEIFSVGNDYFVKMHGKDNKAEKEQAYHTSSMCDERIKMFGDIITYLEGRYNYKVITAKEAAKQCL